MTKLHITAGLSKSGKRRALRLAIRDDHVAEIKRLWGPDARIAYDIVSTRPGCHTVQFFPSPAGSLLRFEVPPSRRGYHAVCFGIGRQHAWLPKIRQKSAYEILSFDEKGVVVEFRDRLPKKVTTARTALLSRGTTAPAPIEFQDNLESLGKAINLVVKTRRANGLTTEISQSEPGGHVTIIGSKKFA